MILTPVHEISWVEVLETYLYQAYCLNPSFKIAIQDKEGARLRVSEADATLGWG